MTNINFPNVKTKGFQLTEPGKTEPKPIGYQSIFSHIQNFIDGNGQELKRNHHSDNTISNYGLTPKTLQKHIDQYNSGVRWFKVVQ